MSKLLINKNVNQKLIKKALFDWMIQNFKNYYEKERISNQVKQQIHDRSIQLVEFGIKNKSLRLFGTNLKIQCICLLAPSRNPRTRGQKALFIYFDSSLGKKIPAQMKQMILDLMLNAPRYSEIAFFEDEESVFKPLLVRSGFKTRYEVMSGDPRTALSKLIEEKNPPLNLQHLNLDIKQIRTKNELEKAINLQRLVSTLSRSHGYFAHTEKQVQSDRQEYSHYLNGKNGLLLGIYSGEKIKGLMVGGIYKQSSSKKITGGLSFFLHSSIQGKGIVKTGYRLILDFLVKNNVKEFYGGTSQPAVQYLSKLMKRKVEKIIYVKM